ncbi:MAG: methyl-accepting chemotaxis protein [Candidatus Thiodiazotropha sp. 6PLUC9]
MQILRQLQIQKKLWLLTATTLLGLLVITAISLDAFHSGLIEEKTLQTQALVDTAHSLIESQHAHAEKGEITMEEAQKRAIKDIEGLRYNGGNYFWINDLNAHIVMHPIKPQLNGKDLSDFKDPDGKRIFSEFAAIAKQEGAGSVPYKWSKPGSDTPVDKISYVKGFKPWGWVVGTGIYIDDVEEEFKHFATMIAVAAMTVVGLFLFISYIITKSITCPLNETVAALNDISTGEGDLTRRLDSSGKDEVAQLATEFNRFIEKIENIIKQVAQSSTQLATAAVELSSTTEQTHENLNQQQNETHQVATAVTEMAATIKEIAESAESAAGSAHTADDQALAGKSVVDGVTQAIDHMASEMDSASDVINRLAKESDGIGAVSDTIRGIAEQTSLLALNAAIEAARAGEQGRGFAVVADEVRSLASRTQEATAEIKEMIERLQSGTQNAVDVIHKSGATTLSTVEKAREATTSLNDIASSISVISERNTQIASASEEQSAVAQEIDKSVVQISQLAQQSSLASEQITQASTELSQLGESMHQMISHFKTS